MTDALDGTCAWATSSPAMRAYHDAEWGVPSRDDRHLFEMLTLEGAQAGLSWSTVLGRRAGYAHAFHGFDVSAVAAMSDDELEALRQDEGIVRHRQKIVATRANAVAFLRVQEEHGSFAAYLWDWVGGTPVVNRPTAAGQLPTTTDLSDRLSKDLKRRGFGFVGSTIVYAYLEAVGLVDDHVVGCPAKRNRATSLPR